MLDEGKKWDTLIRATKLEREELIEIGQLKGYMGLYTVGLEHMYDYLMKNNVVRKHAHWVLLDECSNAGFIVLFVARKCTRPIMLIRRLSQNIVLIVEVLWTKSLRWCNDI